MAVKSGGKKVPYYLEKYKTFKIKQYSKTKIKKPFRNFVKRSH